MAVGFASVADRVVPWNGSRRRILKVPGPLSPTLSVLDQVSCTRASFCLAVGNDGSHTIAEQWNGTSWRVQATPG